MRYDSIGVISNDFVFGEVYMAYQLDTKHLIIKKMFVSYDSRGVTYL
jgi:hypothetical protein